MHFPLNAEQSKNCQAEIPESGAGVRAYIRDLLSGVVSGSDDRLSFTEVVDHHSSLQSDWNREVEADLGELGVDTSTPFRLLYDPAGAALVVGDHPDKEMINAYFTANPGRVRELGETLQFGSLASTAQSKLTPADMDQPLHTEAMAWWYTANMDAHTLFSGGGVVFGAGGTAYRALDIRV
ncbi:hypothetical protein DWB63_16155 [Pseudodesulfovibrio sp. S3]|nr:hypothetical protein DWB63_16155 [Pseudodesulfovibrio sp. S3]